VLQAVQQVRQRGLELLIGVMLGQLLGEPRHRRVGRELVRGVLIRRVDVGFLHWPRVDAAGADLKQQIAEQEGRERAVGGGGAGVRRTPA